MNREEFQTFCYKFRHDAQKIMEAKNQDYRTGGVNQLHYQDIAKDLGITPRQAWAVLFMKQVHAILRYIRDGRVASESIMSRFHDIHNYAILGAALEAELEPGEVSEPADLRCLADAVTEACEQPTSWDAISAEYTKDPNLDLAEAWQDMLDAWLKNPNNSRTPSVSDVLDSEMASMSWCKPTCRALREYVARHDLGLSMKMTAVIERLKGA